MPVLTENQLYVLAGMVLLPNEGICACMIIHMPLFQLTVGVLKILVKVLKKFKYGHYADFQHLLWKQIRQLFLSVVF